MEEIKLNIGEQPNGEDLTLNVEEQHSITENVTSGSPIGKFKSVEALEVAYENLEKEFTKKCQKIKELTDKLASADNAVSVPEYAQNGWDEKVKQFFESNPMAKNYVAEISEVLSSDENISKSENSLERALTKVLANKFVPYEKLVEDESFLNDYIYQNQQISQKIVEKYLDGIQNKKALPLISSRGSGTVSSPVKKPKTIKDAGKMVEAYFKNK